MPLTAMPSSSPVIRNEIEPLGRAARRGEMVERGGELAGDRALHVDGAAAEQHAAIDVAGERTVRPPRLVAGRHHVGVAGEHEVRPAGADAGIEVLDVVGASFGKGHALDGEAGTFQPIGEIAERTTFRRRHRRTAQEIAGEGDGIGGHLGGQSRSSSLMLVFDRVFSSTRLTMTAQ